MKDCNAGVTRAASPCPPSRIHPTDLLSDCFSTQERPRNCTQKSSELMALQTLLYLPSKEGPWGPLPELMKLINCYIIL